MRSFSFTLALTAALVAVGVSANLSRLSRSLPDGVMPTNPDPSSVLHNPTFVRREDSRALSNAQRFARGLPPLPPLRRHPADRRDTPSSCPAVTKNGVIRVDGSSVGTPAYFSQSVNDFGEYFVTSNIASALRVSFQYSSCASANTAVDIIATNGPYAGSYQYLGGFVGYASTNDNISPGSYNYIYIGGTNQSPAGTPPASVGNAFTAITGVQRKSESAIWAYDSATNSLSPQWINTDSSTPVTYAVYVVESGAVALTGDPTRFRATFGSAPSVTFQFISN